MEVVLGPPMAALPSLTALAVFSGLSVNLILQCGFSLKEIALDEEFGKKELFKKLGITFVSIVLLWLVFSIIRTVLNTGFFEYILLFPVSCLVISSLDFLFTRYILHTPAGEEKQIFREAGLTSSALFITLNVAGRFIEVLITALGFTLGIAIAFLIIGEVRRRSSMEAVPRYLRGGPLALIAMGLLSLIFSSAAMMFYRVLEG